MGRVRTKTIKRAARLIVEKYYFKLTPDFQMNKKITQEVAVIASKRTRNKVAGFVTVSRSLNLHLMKRIERGSVPGISLKIQEEERERRMENMPEKSEVDISGFIQLDGDATAMLRDLNIQLNIETPRQTTKAVTHTNR
ncbi:ribosomal protein RPS17 [Cardiosporidium cionae]|uniref:Ribosomal protein RPS17 n=1 Tax=Cardiosporidium cionae TaxID=476202 RepID=A0ABQ7J5W1_9APIC|nr:ribosomal protein RPS17 [Cardiosporidium cionae]|eukprot:KAF8819373.1 ribosomal protein RPS17 [Cardiosporidium cionae]